MRRKVVAGNRNKMCQACPKNFRKRADFKRHLTMIKIGIVSENQKRHSGLF